ncbi:MAG: geranylgeranyl reductase family protein [Candidatus Bipolaricaulaceae bacterium]
MRYEVVVVGGGPAGALAAAAAAQAGAQTLLLERASRRIPVCAGLVSSGTAERLRVPPNLVLREIRGVRLFSPQGRRVELRAEEVKALVLDRPRLDVWLRAQAQEAGADLWPVEAKGIEGNQLFAGREAVPFEVVVGADGVQSGVARWTGLPGPQEVLVAAQAEVEEDIGDEVEVHLGVVPDFFAWAVPAEEGLTRAGLATASGRRILSQLRDFLGRRFPQAKVRGLRTGLIPLDAPTRIVDGRALLVGNAAGHTKPLTGGGLAFITRCAPLAGELAAQGPKALPQYSQRCQELIGEEKTFEAQARRLFLGLKPRAVEQAIRALEHPPLRSFLAEVGDIDHFAEIGKTFLRNPKLWPLLLSLARLLPHGRSV